MKHGRKKVLILAIIVPTFVLATFWLIYFYYPSTVQPTGACTRRHENGLWLRYKWSAGDKEYWKSSNEMINHLKNDQIRFAYFHLRELNTDGRLAIRKEEQLKTLTGFVHEEALDAKVIAWISLGSAYPANGTDLSNEFVRKNAIEEAKWLTDTCGFDGVQWDYEPCQSGDRNFIKLLEESRKALSADKMLSVATPMCALEGEASTWYTWDEKYFSEVAANCDQLAVMCYDLVLIFPWQYESALRKQILKLSATASSCQKKCEVILGLPTYDRNFIHDHCEQLPLALKAVHDGAQAAGASSDAIAGVALFADYTTDENEWSLYRRCCIDNGALENSSAAHLDPKNVK